ncbi:hypothetical protein IAU59_004758 [Kwoniella sp. CBS 9459]
MYAPPGVDTSSSGEETTPPPSPEPEPIKHHFSLRSLFTSSRKSRKSKKQGPSREEIKTSTPVEAAEADPKLDTDPLKPKKRVRIFAGELENGAKIEGLTDNQGEEVRDPDPQLEPEAEQKLTSVEAVVDLPLEPSTVAVDGKALQGKDGVAGEVLTLLRKLMADSKDTGDDTQATIEVATEPISQAKPTDILSKLRADADKPVKGSPNKLDKEKEKGKMNPQSVVVTSDMTREAAPPSEPKLIIHTAPLVASSHYPGLPPHFFGPDGKLLPCHPPGMDPHEYRPSPLSPTSDEAKSGLRSAPILSQKAQAQEGSRGVGEDELHLMRGPKRDISKNKEKSIKSSKGEIGDTRAEADQNTLAQDQAETSSNAPAPERASHTGNSGTRVSTDHNKRAEIETAVKKYKARYADAKKAYLKDGLSDEQKKEAKDQLRRAEGKLKEAMQALQGLEVESGAKRGEGSAPRPKDKVKGKEHSSEVEIDENPKPSKGEEVVESHTRPKDENDVADEKERPAPRAKSPGIESDRSHLETKLKSYREAYEEAKKRYTHPRLPETKKSQAKEALKHAEGKLKAAMRALEKLPKDGNPGDKHGRGSPVDDEKERGVDVQQEADGAETHDRTKTPEDGKVGSDQQDEQRSLDKPPVPSADLAEASKEDHREAGIEKKTEPAADQSDKRAELESTVRKYRQRYEEARKAYRHPKLPETKKDAARDALKAAESKMRKAMQALEDLKGKTKGKGLSEAVQSGKGKEADKSVQAKDGERSNKAERNNMIHSTQEPEQPPGTAQSPGAATAKSERPKEDTDSSKQLKNLEMAVKKYKVRREEAIKAYKKDGLAEADKHKAKEDVRRAESKLKEASQALEKAKSVGHPLVTPDVQDDADKQEEKKIVEEDQRKKEERKEEEEEEEEVEYRTDREPIREKEQKPRQEEEKGAHQEAGQSDPVQGTATVVTNSEVVPTAGRKQTQEEQIVPTSRMDTGQNIKPLEHSAAGVVTSPEPSNADLQAQYSRLTQQLKSKDLTTHDREKILSKAEHLRTLLSPVPSPAPAASRSAGQSPKEVVGRESVLQQAQQKYEALKRGLKEGGSSDEEREEREAQVKKQKAVVVALMNEMKDHSRKPDAVYKKGDKTKSKAAEKSASSENSDRAKETQKSSARGVTPDQVDKAIRKAARDRGDDTPPRSQTPPAEARIRAEIPTDTSLNAQPLKEQSDKTDAIAAKDNEKRYKEWAPLKPAKKSSLPPTPAPPPKSPARGPSPRNDRTQTSEKRLSRTASQSPVAVHDDGNGGSRKPQPEQISWSKTLVALAHCIDLANTLLTSLLARQGPNPLISIVQHLVAGLMMQRDLLNSLKGIVGEGNGELLDEFGQHVNVIKRYVEGLIERKKKVDGRKLEEGERLVQKGSQVLENVSVQGVVSHLMTFTDYLTPGMMTALRAVFEEWKKEGMCMKSVLFTVCSVRRELLVILQEGTQEPDELIRTKRLIGILDRILAFISPETVQPVLPIQRTASNSTKRLTLPRPVSPTSPSLILEEEDVVNFPSPPFRDAYKGSREAVRSSDATLTHWDDEAEKRVQRDVALRRLTGEGQSGVPTSSPPIPQGFTLPNTSEPFLSPKLYPHESPHPLQRGKTTLKKSKSMSFRTPRRGDKPEEAPPSSLAYLKDKISHTFHRRHDPSTAPQPKRSPLSHSNDVHLSVIVQPGIASSPEPDTAPRRKARPKPIIAPSPSQPTYDRGVTRVEGVERAYEDTELRLPQITQDFLGRSKSWKKALMSPLVPARSAGTPARPGTAPLPAGASWNIRQHSQRRQDHHHTHKRNDSEEECKLYPGRDKGSTIVMPPQSLRVHRPPTPPDPGSAPAQTLYPHSRSRYRSAGTPQHLPPAGHPVEESSSSLYSPSIASDSTAESDEDAQRLLALADSGPKPVRHDWRDSLDLDSDEDKKKKKKRDPSAKKVKRAESLLYHKVLPTPGPVRPNRSEKRGIRVNLV